MNSGPTPPRPDDEARDPLLTALEQRLHGYGQAPPPGTWAAIRQQLPPALPRPWWRRPRRLLPLLALLLGLVAVGTLVVRHDSSKIVSQYFIHQTIKALGTPNKLLTTSAPARRTSRPAASATVAHATSIVPLTSTGASHPGANAATTTATTAKHTRTTTLAQRPFSGFAHPPKAANNPSKNRRPTHVVSPQRAAPTTRTSAAVGPHHPAAGATQLASFGERYQQQQQLTTSQATSRPRRAKHRAAHRSQGSSVAASSSSSQLLLEGASSGASARLGRPHKAKTTEAPHSAARMPSAANRQNAAATLIARSKRAQQKAAFAAADELVATPSEQPGASDSLALRAVALALPLDWEGPTLVARPDSAQFLPRARRWALLVLAGPTLSYRTLGAAPALAARHPDFARLERPALGFGAQVQVRHVLSGRWALAAGLGYHEYATRLTLSIIDSSTSGPRPVRQRDVYRVLTLPVQLSYALGAPRGRLAWALFFGAEPSWYLGGRSTEGSDCGCQQQRYPLDSARTGPYRPLTLALSLGLDLHYRLGGPASRWQWVAQPTARYVATPFVRSEALGFTRRQPWSLGLLTGISWDIR